MTALGPCVIFERVMNMSAKDKAPLKYLESISQGRHRLLQCRRFNQSSDIWILREHEHEFLELIYFLSGEAQIKTNRGETRLALYDVLVHPAHVKHREFVDLHKRQEIINLCIDVETDVNIGESFVLSDNSGNIRRVFQMLDSGSSSDLLREEIEEKLLGLLFAYMRKSVTEQPCTEYDLIDRVIEYVQENYMSMLTVKNMADYVNVSESYLSRLMRSHVGISPMKYVNSVRMENAKQALKSDLPIEHIAALVGFMEPKYFSTVFKRETGLTPSEFRKSISNKQ